MLTDDPTIESMEIDDDTSMEEAFVVEGHDDATRLQQGSTDVVSAEIANSENTIISPMVSQDSSPSTAASVRCQLFQEEEAMSNKSSCASDDVSLDFDSDGEEMNDPEVSTPFDFRLLKRSIENGCATLDQVVDKDVVLVLGKTGTGKSTFIQAIAGKRMKTVGHAISIGSHSAFHQVYEAEDPLEGFDIGHSKLSETKSIKGYEHTTTKGTKLLFVDSPGFEDTDGYEMDIATSIMLLEVAKLCKSLRFVVLINFVSFLEDRGGSVAAVLKFVGSFVRDFESEKKSFMFLFSHTNELKDVTCMEDATKKVQLEIARMLNVKQEARVSAVLKFMKKSLDRQYLFANVFNPILTDMNQLLKFIESQVKPVQGQTFSSNGGLTTASRLKLAGEVHKLSNELQQELNSSEMNTDKISEISNTLDYLKNRVDVNDVEEAASKCSLAILQFCTDTKEFIGSQLSRATDREHEFWDQDRNSLLNAIGRYNLLSGEDISIDYVYNRVDELKDCNFSADFESSRLVALQLRKLHVWVGESESFRQLYEQTVQSLKGKLEEVTSSLVRCSPSSFFQDEDQIQRFMEYCAIVDAITLSADSLAEHSLPVHDAIEASTELQSAIALEVSSWENELLSFESHFEPTSLPIMLTNAEKLQLVCTFAKPQSQRLKEAASHVLRSFESEILTYYEMVTSDFSTMQAPTEYDVNVLKILNESARGFSRLDGMDWKQLIPLVDRVVQNLRAKVRVLESEISLNSQVVTESGFTTANVVRCISLLVEFSQFMFLDDLLDAKDAFVGNVSIALHHPFIDRMDFVDERVGELVSQLMQEKTTSTETGKLADLVGLLPEVEAIAQFSRGISNQNYSTLIERVQSRILQYLREIKIAIDQTFQKWESLLSSGDDPRSIADETEVLNGQLRTLEMIGNSAASLEIRSVAEGIQQTNTSRLEIVSNSIVDHFNAESPDFHILAKQLSIVKAFGCFTFTKDHLPDYSNLSMRATKLVSTAAEAVEQKVDASACWDEIDTLLSRLEEAQVLDLYTSNQASSRLGPLHKLREKKSEDVDAAVEEMIRENNFSGLGELIIPLSKSTDQLKRQKFNHYSDKICSQLQDVQQKLNHSFDSLTCESAPIVYHWMEILAKAKSELGKHLQSKLNLGRVLTAAKQKLGSALKHRTDRFLERVEHSLSYSQMAIEIFEASNLADKFNSFLSNKTRTNIKKMIEQYDKKKKEISDHVERFFTQKFSHGSHLLHVMSSLQRSSSDEHDAVKELSILYASKKTEITDRLVRHLTELNKSIEENSCYVDGVKVLKSLVIELDNGLSEHIDVNMLPYDCMKKLKVWEESVGVEKREKLLDNALSDQDIADLCKKLQRNRLCQKISFFGWSFGDYEEKCSILQREVEAIYKKGSSALNTKDFAEIRDSAEKLRLVSSSLLLDHIPSSRKLYEELSAEIKKSFLSSLKEAVDVLPRNQFDVFKSNFRDIKGFTLHLPSFSSTDTQKLFTLVNQLVYDKLEKRTTHLKELLSFESDDIDFLEIRSQVEDIRDFGGFVADQYLLMLEEVKLLNQKLPHKWLEEISGLCHRDFREGRNLSNIRLYAILGVAPSASKAEIRRAFRKKALLHHPDKNARATTGAFQQAKEAHDKLCDSWLPIKSRPFDSLIKCIGESLMKKVKTLLAEESYDIVESLLFKMPALTQLKNLVEPKLPCKRIQSEIETLCRNHVKAARTNIQSLWTLRKYRELNESIEDLQKMELHFKSHQAIFPDSWNDGIVKAIQDEISKLGKEARGMLATKKTAHEAKTEFRRCILQMGCVLVDLPLFHTFTKGVMSEVLECSLMNEWGFAFLFEIGLSLRRGDDDTEDEKRVAYQIISEFSYFKEIETMCWNTETTQKPAEDTSSGIWAETLSLKQQSISIDHVQLLRSYSVFDADYKTLLGEYLGPESNRDELIQRTISLCDQAKPVLCESGWDDSIKAVLPRVLAGVFALFTVLKSGESFERVDSQLGDQLLLKPHNIQILTLLYMFGCDSPGLDSLSSQLLRIRTGEGKSIILGAAACVLALFGFKVRCVCYSEYLSSRDYVLFKDLIEHLGLRNSITYSKITTLSEDTTAAKGDIRNLTNSLMHGNLSCGFSGQNDDSPSQLHLRRPRKRSTNKGKTRARKKKAGARQSALQTRVLSQSVENHSIKKVVQEEILLVDEVDVFFGSDFYGKTYNLAAQIYEPEIRKILELIWNEHKRGLGRRQNLHTVTKTQAYKDLLSKMPHFKSVIDNEIMLMLDQVRRVNDEEYYLKDDKIGYKDMDTINYKVTYGYRTTFAYLQEYDRGMIGSDALASALCMNISCGQFSYANIQPARIMGVSGTLEAMGDFEKKVLTQYGIEKFVYMPSVYGKSNFDFQKAGDGLFIESSSSDFFHKLISEISKAVRKKRAVIVFFRDAMALLEFEKSPFYRQLGRQKSKLVENMAPEMKDFVIKKAATSGQVTFCSAAFGRGTDFFCKDQRVLDNGGVHVIQTFLSTELSEEIQIQGRTARQGKEGTYQMILLDQDLNRDFDLSLADLEQKPKSEWYDCLSLARKGKYKSYCESLVENLEEATKRDCTTREYFEAMLSFDEARSIPLLKDIYFNMKQIPMPSKISIDLCFAVDVTGSMSPYMVKVDETIASLLEGQTSVGLKLRSKFPQVEFVVRSAILGFRDIDDGGEQFCEALFDDTHFMDDTKRFATSLKSIIKKPSGGHDLAEDVLGAVHRCASWSKPMDWSGDIKFAILFTDAPSHGMVPPCSVGVSNADSYSVLHPDGLTTEKVADALLSRDIDLFFCSFNPAATERTEANLNNALLGHNDNVDQNEIVSIPMVNQSPQSSLPILMSSGTQHTVFVLDESGSMRHDWSGVVNAYKNYLACRMQNQNTSDLVSVVQFDGSARTVFECIPIGNAPSELGYSGGGTCFSPAAVQACQIVRATLAVHDVPVVVVFMSDGVANEGDAQHCASIFSSLNAEYRQQRGTDLQLHVIAFGPGLDQRQLQEIMRSTPKGRIHTSIGSTQLSDVFVDIANTSQDVGAVLEKEIGRRISDTVADKLVVEYLR